MATSNYKQNTHNIWFPNQVEPDYTPDNSQEFLAYWRREKERMRNGFYIADGQVYISGWLYWHTVYWKIKMKKTINNRTFPVIEAPLLRDIDFDAAINFERALDEGTFIELVGSRGFGKTVWQSSYAGRIYTIYDRSQVLVSGGNSSDIKVVTDKLSEGLDTIHPVLRKKRLRNDWKVEVLAGFKTPDGDISEKSSRSQILVRNYQDGNDSMAANGTRPEFHIIDEIGKIRNFLKCVKDSDGCWWDNDKLPEGQEAKPTCLPMFTGTGGDMEVGADAAEMFFDPINNNLLSFDDEWEGKGKIGWFMPCTKARFEYKEPKTLAEYLKIDHPDLQAITILVSNEEKCLEEWWTPRYKKALKSGNSNSLISFKAYWPLVPSDSFLVLKQNDFNVEAAKAQKDRLVAQGVTGNIVELFHDGESIKHKFVDKLPITEFPVKTQDKDAPVQIWEFPIASPPFGLYVAGVDPYRHSEAEYSNSVGAVYIYKRMHSITSENYQNMFVACYAARPQDKNKWNETARNLIKYYNARTLCENDEMGFIDYMIAKGDGHFLEDQPEWLKEYVPNTKVDRKKGIHRSSLTIRNFLDSTFKSYLDEVIETEKDPETGSIIKERLGISKVLDPMLCEEITKFSKATGKDKVNTDRVVAAELAVALAFKLDPIIGAIGTEDNRIKGLYKTIKGKQETSKSSLFKGTSGFRNKKTTLFR